MEDADLDVPEYYTIDPVTGALSFANRPHQIVADRLKIVIHSTDGVEDRVATPDYVYPHVQMTEVITVVTQCGPQSTVVGLPDLYPLRELADSTDGDTLELSDAFSSSNYLCPIESYTLLYGDEFDLTSNAPAAGAPPTSFTVRLKDVWRTIAADNAYSYQIVATARGGASGY